MERRREVGAGGGGGCCCLVDLFLRSTDFKDQSNLSRASWSRLLEVRVKTFSVKVVRSACQNIQGQDCWKKLATQWQGVRLGNKRQEDRSKLSPFVSYLTVS